MQQRGLIPKGSLVSARLVGERGLACQGGSGERNRRFIDIRIYMSEHFKNADNNGIPDMAIMKSSPSQLPMSTSPASLPWFYGKPDK